MSRFAAAMLGTHAAYVLVAAITVLVLRHVRRRLERIAERMERIAGVVP